MLLCKLARHVEGLICRSGIIPNRSLYSRIGDGFEIAAKDLAEIRVCSVPLCADSLKRIVHPTLLCNVAMA
jgi:hypothetical protein